MGQFGNVIESGFCFARSFFGIGEHSPIIWVARTRQTQFVPVVDHRHARESHEKGEGHPQLCVGRGMVYSRGIFPPRFLFVRLARIGKISVGISEEARFVVIAKEGRHGGFETVDAFRIGYGSFQFGKAGGAQCESGKQGVVERKIELAIQFGRTDEASDSFPSHKSFSNKVEGWVGSDGKIGAKARAKCGPEFGRNVFDGIEAESVEVESFDPIDGVGNEETGRIRLIVVEAGEERFEPCGELGFRIPFAEIFRSIGESERAEPVGMILEDRIILMDVGEN